MTFDVLVFKVLTNYTGSWPSDMGSHTISADNYLHVQLNDSTYALTVVYSSSSVEGGGTIYGTLTDGPNLFYGYGGSVQQLTSAPYYQWCDTTTLKQIAVTNAFPYSFIQSYPGASECVVAPTCDLEISSLYSITEASGPSTADGAITISASGSNGTIKFSLNPAFVYASEGQTSGTFSGLVPGDYTIYAKDPIGCQDNISFTIPVTTVYGVRFRLDFTDSLDISGKYSRVDILERAYAGAISDICGDGTTPIEIVYKGSASDPSKSLITSSAELNLAVETEGQFTDLYTGDDRQFLVKYYIGDDVGSLSIYWTGYIVPEFHSEPYLFTPYILSVTASDQLGELKNQYFLDLFDNQLKGELKSIKVIAEILKKTNLNLNIRSGLNIFDSNMNTASTDDPLDQAYVDCRIYYNKKVPVKCDAAITSFVEPFRAQIFQSQGVWWIIRLSDAVGTFAYREFDYLGDYSSNGSISPVLNLDVPSAVRAAQGAMFQGRTQILSFLENYGYFAITHDLKKDGNLIDEGDFEEEDIIELASGNLTFKNWNVLLGQAGVIYGFDTVDNGTSKGAFFFDFDNVQNTQVDTQVYSAVIPVDNDDNGKIRLKFQYKVKQKYDVPYVRIAWTLKTHTTIGNYYWLVYTGNGGISFDTTEKKQEIYVTDFDSWNTFDLTTSLPGSGSSETIDSIEISFFFHNHYGRDFDGILTGSGSNTLQDYSLKTDLSNPNGARRMVQGATGETNLYIAYWGNDATSSPDFIRPSDYNVGGGTKDWMWRLDEVMGIGFGTSLITRLWLDNVGIAYYPFTGTGIAGIGTKYLDPPETLVYDQEVSVYNKSDFEKDVLLGDMIRFNTLNGVSTDYYNEQYIYRSFFRLSDGTPTELWSRVGVSEAKRLLQITLEDYISQFSDPQRQLSGSMVTNQVIHFVNAIEDQLDNTRYRPQTFKFNPKQAMYTIDMCGVVAGADGEPPVSLGEFDPLEFDNSFLIGN